MENIPKQEKQEKTGVLITDKRVYRLIAEVVLLVVIMVLIAVRLINYVESSVHQERTVYLKAQTETTAGLIDRLLTQYMDYSAVCARTISRELTENEDLGTFLEEIDDKLYMEDARLILIDENTTWYAKGGAGGRITAPEYYGDKSPDELVYITTGVDVSVESFVFRQRLENPVKVRTEHGERIISYCAVIYYMGNFEQELKLAFPYECNSFVVDSSGLILYNNLELSRLMGGTNIFAKYSRVEFLYEDKGEDLVALIRAGEPTTGEFRLEGRNYFICSAPLKYNGWSVLFVIPSDILAAGSYIRTMFIYVLIIGFVFTAAILLIGLISLQRHRERTMLETQQKANIHLQKASQAKSDFLSNMTHDIRTPINGIMGMTMLASKEDNPPKTRECLKKIDLSARYLLSLVNDVLDMASIESGKIELSAEPVNLKAFMNGCISIVSGQAAEKGLELVTETDGILHPAVLGDEVHLRQIMINILGNAVKFTPKGGTVRFTGAEEEARQGEGRVRVRFEISDTGIGMSRQFLEKIWERFAQAEAGGRTKYKGTGLGMAITRQLVDLMGGEITVESEPGKGSTFRIWIEFPKAEETVQTAGISEETQQELEGIRILLVEDNEINQEIARELLEGEGAQVKTAENGKEAVDLFREDPKGFDLILMDLMMPVMNGLEAAREIRSLSCPEAEQIPIIAMTANTMEEDLKAAAEAGMNTHLPKPVNLPLMKKTILNFVRRRKPNESV